MINTDGLTTNKLAWKFDQFDEISLSPTEFIIRINQIDLYIKVIVYFGLFSFGSFCLRSTS